MALPPGITLPPGLREVGIDTGEGIDFDYVDVNGQGGYSYRDDGTWGRWNRDITGYDEGGGEMLGASYFTPYTATQDFAAATPGATLQDMKWWGTPNTAVNGSSAAKWMSPSGAEPTVVRAADGTLMMQLPQDARSAGVVSGDGSDWMDTAIRGAATAAISGGLFSGSGLGSYLNSNLGNVGGAMARGAITSGVTGGNPLMGAVSGGASAAMPSLSEILGKVGMSPSVTESTQTMDYPTRQAVMGWSSENGGTGMDSGAYDQFNEAIPGFEDFGGYDQFSEVVPSYPGADWSGAINTGGGGDELSFPPGYTIPMGFGGSNVYGSEQQILDAVKKGLLPISALGAAASLLGRGAQNPNSLSSLLRSLGMDTGSYGGAVDAFGRAIPGLIGAYAANRQADTLANLAKQSQEYGAPSRARYEASMAPGFDPMGIPGYKTAIDNSMESQLYGLSTQGNPFGNPSGLIDANKRVVAGTAMPAIQNYQQMNAVNGGLASMNSAVPGLQAASAQASGNIFNALGGAAADAFSTPKDNSLATLLKQFQGNNIFG